MMSGTEQETRSDASILHLDDIREVNKLAKLL